MSRQIQKLKNYQNPTSTSKDISRTISIILFILLSNGDSLKFKATQQTRLISSHVNVIHVRM